MFGMRMECALGMMMFEIHYMYRQIQRATLLKVSLDTVPFNTFYAVRVFSDTK
jgi:hypothetical protein